MIGICTIVLPGIHFYGKYEKWGVRAYFILLFILYTSIGVYMVLSALPDIYYLTPYITANFYFAILSLIIIAIAFNPEWDDDSSSILNISKFQQVSRFAWFITNIIAFCFIGVLLTIVLFTNVFAYGFFSICTYSFSIIILIIIVKKQSIENKKLIVISAFSFATLFFLFSYVSAFASPYSALYLAEVEFSEATDVLSDVVYSIIGNGLFMFVLVLIIIGGLAKVVSATKAASLISNILVMWLPSMIWILVIFGVVPVPYEIIKVFGGLEFLAWLMFILIYGALMTLASGAVQVFVGLKLISSGV